MDNLEYNRLLDEVNEYLAYIKNRKAIINDAITALNIIWLGELLSRYRGDIALSEDALKIIDFRHRFSHVKPNNLASLQEKLDDTLKILSTKEEASDLIDGILAENQKKVKKKNIKTFTNDEIISFLKETELNKIIGYASRIIDAPEDNNFNLERNYIIFPEFVTDIIDANEIRRIIFQTLGNHAVLRLVRKIKEEPAEKEMLEL